MPEIWQDKLSDCINVFVQLRCFDKCRRKYYAILDTGFWMQLDCHRQAQAPSTSRGARRSLDVQEVTHGAFLYIQYQASSIVQHTDSFIFLPSDEIYRFIAREKRLIFEHQSNFYRRRHHEKRKTAIFQQVVFRRNVAGSMGISLRSLRAVLPAKV